MVNKYFLQYTVWFPFVLSKLQVNNNTATEIKILDRASDDGSESWIKLLAVKFAYPINPYLKLYLKYSFKQLTEATEPYFLQCTS